MANASPTVCIVGVGLLGGSLALALKGRRLVGRVVGTDRLPARVRHLSQILSELCMGAMAVFMIIYGCKLAMTTWGNSVDEFPWLSVGLTYLPIPIGGAAMGLFVIERLWLGAPPAHRMDAEPAVNFD